MEKETKREEVIKLNEQEFFNKLIYSIDIEDYKGDTLCDVYLKVDDYPIFWRSKVYLDDILPNCEIYLDNNIQFIKSVKLSKFSNCILIKLYSELEIENMYKSYLESKLEYEHPNDEYVIFYPTEGIEYEELKSNGFKIKLNLDVNVYSYIEFKYFLSQLGLDNYLVMPHIV